jgi:hypothetical protein
MTPAQWVALVVSASLVSIGCSGASSSSAAADAAPNVDDGGDEGRGPGADGGNDADDEGGDDAGDGWNHYTNIEAIFEANCASCHGSQFSSCWTVQANATPIQGAVSSGAMPRGGKLSPSDLAALLAWLDAGAPCSGPRQEAGTIIFGGGTPTATTP